MFKFCGLKQNAIVKYVPFPTYNEDVEERIDVLSAVGVWVLQRWSRQKPGHLWDEVLRDSWWRAAAGEWQWQGQGREPSVCVHQGRLVMRLLVLRCARSSLVASLPVGCRLRSNLACAALTDCKRITKCYTVLWPLPVRLGTVSKEICESISSATWIVSSWRNKVSLMAVWSEKSLCC